MFSFVHATVWCQYLVFFNVRKAVKLCDCTWGLYTDPIRESALKVDSGRKNTCRTGHSNPRQYCAWLSLSVSLSLSLSLFLCLSACLSVCLFLIWTLYQLSCLRFILIIDTALNLHTHTHTPVIILTFTRQQKWEWRCALLVFNIKAQGRQNVIIGWFETVICSWWNNAAFEDILSMGFNDTMQAYFSKGGWFFKTVNSVFKEREKGRDVTQGK